ncbi:hypothetical protein CYMTET_2983 [Cymbomonas tetramitiformis]|uniref:GPS domain-containing protein n=1 Tax=Cymbomonas tetramitiformis TaxID=36881 RepID=A0AAE0H450_9CHLO|nr:hypothetical protein CYMTET_2983 [Cymbomonas tetramitiformis]
MLVGYMQMVGAPSRTPPPPPPSPPPPTYTLGSGASSIELYYQATTELTCARVNLNSTVAPSTLAISTTNGPSSLAWGMDDYSCVDGLCSVNLCGFSIGSYSLLGNGTMSGVPFLITGDVTVYHAPPPPSPPPFPPSLPPPPSPPPPVTASPNTASPTTLNPSLPPTLTPSRPTPNPSASPTTATPAASRRPHRRPPPGCLPTTSPTTATPTASLTTSPTTATRLSPDDLTDGRHPAASPTTSPITATPSASPNTALSTSATATPSASPTVLSVIANTQTFSITFTTMSYTDLSANNTLYNLVIQSYSTTVSDAAKVPSSQVLVTSVYAGSVIIDTTVHYSEMDMAAGASPDSLSSILSGGFSSLVEMFASSNILADYASAGVSATTAVTTSASVPNASEDEALEEVASAPEASTAEAEAETFAAVLEELASAPEASMAVPEETSAAAPATADPSSRVPPDLTSESNSNDTRPTAAKADASDVSLEEAMGSTCNSSWCSWCTDADACLDENGCAAADAQCYGECIDVQAPGVGHTCAPCPAGMVGDGVTCGTNLCYDSNGGCDPAVTCRMDAATGARLCGDCKSGEGPVDSASVPAGWVCAEVDGCAEEPCWSEGDSFQLCEDVAAPGTGRICGACPTGFAPSLSDGCVDVDECQIANGGCWVSQEDPSIRTHCRNAPGAHSCTACPEGFIGSGEAGCRARVMCHTNYGNCDPRAASCTDNAITGYAECGPCPAGYSGTGDTVCVDADGCVQDPCFPGVECTDKQAPDTGRTCGACPEGYRGDGGSCEKCDLLLSVDDAMGTLVDGAMKRSVVNQLMGAFAGLSATDCVLTEARTRPQPPFHTHAHTTGVQYLWDGVTSDGAAVLLEEVTNPRTLTLYLPKSTLVANVAYSMRLTASLRGNPGVSSTVATAFTVKRQGLVALIQGGSVRTGEGLPVELDAGASYDPDDEPGEMTFSWACTRTDSSVTPDEGSRCHDTNGTLLPMRMTSAALSLMLQGAPQGANYTLTCEVAKAERKAQVTTHVVILGGLPPVPLIMPMYQLKHPANTKLTLTSQVQALQPESLVLEWSMAPVGEDTEVLALADIAATPLDRLELVVRRDTLAPGAAYRFSLAAADANGPASAVLEVHVNSPPHSGSLLAPSPLEGVMLETPFLFEGSGWEDDAEDKPLWYQLRCAVVGAAGTEQTMLSQWQPSPVFSTSLPVAGLEAFGHVVTAYLYVKDALDATAFVSQSVVVREVAFQDDEAQEAYVDGALADAAQGVANGEDTSISVLAVASILGDADTARDGAGNISLARLAQREAMMGVVRAVWEQLAPTTDTVTRVAQSTAAAGNNPAELTVEARRDILAISETMVAATLSGDPGARLTEAGATALVSGLSSVAIGALGGANQSAELAAAVDVVRSIGLSNGQELVPGEEAVSVATETLSSVVQCEDLSAGGASVVSPTGSQVSVPPSAGKHLGASAERVNIMVTGCAADPHTRERGHGGKTKQQNVDASSKLRQLMAANAASSADAAEDAVHEHPETLTVSNVTSISFYGSGNSSELEVRQLEEPILFTLPIHRPQSSEAEAAGSASSAAAPFYGAECVYWDEAEEAYRSEGCTTLPNPTPPGSLVYWRTRNVSGLASLAEAWAVEGAEGSNLTAGCRETWGAVYPDYLGTDAGYRKYLGAECKLTGGGPLGSNVSCWWEWRSQSFEGPGCVWAADTACLCTHLTDFAAAQQTEVGSTEPPDRVSTYSMDEMGRLSLEEVSQSVVLLVVLAIFMLGAPSLYLISNFFHNRERLLLLLQMVDSSGGGGTFQDMNGMWTWSIVNKKSGNAIDRLKSGKGLGSVFSEMAQQQKKLMDDERMGIQKRATHAASKWRKKGKSRMNTSGNSMSPDVEGPQEPQEGRASGSGGSVLQQRLRAAYKRNVLINLLSTAADLSLRPDEGRKEQERNSPSPAKTSKVLNVDSGKATVKIHAPTQKVNGWGDQSSVKSSNRAMSRPEVMSLNAPFEPGEGAIEPRGEEEVPQKQLASKGDEDLRRNADVPPFGYDPNMVLVKETITTTTTTTTREIWQPESAPGAGPVAESYEPLNQESPPATPAAAESGQRGSAWTGAWWRKSTAKKASEEMMSMLVDPVSLHKVEKARAKKPVGLTARALFNAMQINIFRLQLCIPLNYLEEQSKLQLTDKRRHKRNLNLSAQAKVDIGEELSAAADAPLLRTKSGSSGPVTEAFQDGDGGIQAAVGAEEGQEETTVYAEQQRLLRSQAAPGIGGGAQAEQPASRATSPQEETLPLCVTAPISDPAPQDSVANRRPSTKARSSWLMLRTKTELPVERMIGTAMVQAFLGIKAIMSKWDLANQARMASNAPWQMPNNRPFTWWVSAFKVLIGSTSRNGWYQRSALWNAVFLQRIDGSFEMTSHLASMLRAGEPMQDLVDNPIASHDVLVLQVSMPAKLRDLFKEHLEQSDLEAEDARILTEECWATILIMQWLETVPFSWTENPNDPPKEQVTLRGRSEMFLHSVAMQYPQFNAMLPELKEIAAQYVEVWTEDHNERIKYVYSVKGPHTLERQKSLASLANMSLAEKRTYLMQQFRRSSNTAARYIKWLMKSHPLGAIYLVNATEPFSRSERILIQANTFILMLVFTVWFYYSKAVNCCKDFRVFTDCPNPFEVNEPCFGYDFCAALRQAGTEEMLPEEVFPSNFLCTAFPQGSFAGTPSPPAALNCQSPPHSTRQLL